MLRFIIKDGINIMINILISKAKDWQFMGPIPPDTISHDILFHKIMIICYKAEYNILTR